MVQFFFPSADEPKEVFCGHYLARTWTKKATGSRLQEGRLTPSEPQEWGLASEDSSWFDGGSSFAGEPRGVGDTKLTLCTGMTDPSLDGPSGVLFLVLWVCSGQVI